MREKVTSPQVERSAWRYGVRPRRRAIRRRCQGCSRTSTIGVRRDRQGQGTLGSAALPNRSTGSSKRVRLFRPAAAEFPVVKNVFGTARSVSRMGRSRLRRMNRFVASSMRSIWLASLNWWTPSFSAATARVLNRYAASIRSSRNRPATPGANIAVFVGGIGMYALLTLIAQRPRSTGEGWRLPRAYPRSE